MAPPRRTINKGFFRKKQNILLQLTFSEAWDEIANRIAKLHSKLHPTNYTVSVGGHGDFEQSNPKKGKK